MYPTKQIIQESSSSLISKTRSKPAFQCPKSMVSSTRFFVEQSRTSGIHVPHSSPSFPARLSILGPDFCVPATTQMVVKIKPIWSQVGIRNYSTIIEFHTIDGNLIFKVGSSRFGSNLEVKRVLYDETGTPIACAQKKKKALCSQWDAHRGNQCERTNRLFKVKKLNGYNSETSLEVTFDDFGKGWIPNIHVFGDYNERQCRFQQQNQTIAEVCRNTSTDALRSMFTLIIQPHVDLAFIALMVTIIEEIHSDSSK